MMCTVVTLAANVIIQYMKLLAVVIFIVFVLMLIDGLRAPPYYHDAANYMTAVTGALGPVGHLSG